MEIPNRGINRPPHKESGAKSEFVILENSEYFDALRDLIPKAKHRVWLQTMHIHSDGPTLEMRDLLIAAADRNVDARFTVDSYYRFFLDGSLYYVPHLSSAKRNRMKAAKRDKDEIILAELQRNNVNVTVTNPPRTLRERLNPARGRNHNKMALIDDIGFVGDINIVGGRSSPGLMVKVTDPVLVESLANIYQTSELGRGGQDYEVIGADRTALLVDKGVPGQSLILDRALSAIGKAKKTIKLTSQFTPDGEILKALQAAHENDVEVSPIVSSPEVIDRYWQALFDRKNQLMLRAAGFSFPILEVPEWIHAKILLIDEGLPTEQAIVGTHCFSGKGVDWGTQEVALQSQNPDLIGQLSAYVGDFENRGEKRNTQVPIRKIIFAR